MKKRTVHREERFELATSAIVGGIVAMSAAIGHIAPAPLAVALCGLVAAWIGWHVQDDPRIIVPINPHPAKRYTIVACLAAMASHIALVLRHPDTTDLSLTAWGGALAGTVVIAVALWCLLEKRSRSSA
jgi:hypothetical protein